MKPRPLRSRSIPEQHIEDVFAEFYRLDSIIKAGGEYQRNYVITRLVTIIEQFFRNIVEDRLYNLNGKAPRKMELDPAIIDEIAAIHSKEEREITRELVISINHKFQSGDEIKDTMKEYGVEVFWNERKKTSGLKKESYDELFGLRHKIVHTFEQPPSKIRKYYELTEELFKHVLDQITMWHPSFYFLKIDALVDLGEYEKAAECFKKEAGPYFDSLPTKSSKGALAYYDRGLTLQCLGEYGKAAGDFDRVISLTRNSNATYSYMGMRLRKSRENSEGVRLQELAEYSKGAALQEINEHGSAIECFNEGLKLNPSDIDTHIAKGESLIKLGRHEEARECLRNSVWVSYPIDGFEYRNIAKLLLDLGDIAESAKCFTKALTLFNDRIDSGDADASYGKGMLLQDLGDDVAAVKCFTESLEADPNDDDVYVLKGLALLKLGNYAEAVECFNSAMKVGPNNALAHYGLGAAPQKPDSRGLAAVYFDLALSLLDVTLATEPNSAVAYHYKGVALQGLSKPEAAIECFDKAIELDPNYADAYRSKGSLLQDLDDLNEAKKCFGKITKLDKRRREVKKMVDRMMGRQHA